MTLAESLFTLEAPDCGASGRCERLGYLPHERQKSSHVLVRYVINSVVFSSERIGGDGVISDFRRCIHSIRCLVNNE